MPQTLSAPRELLAEYESLGTRVQGVLDARRQRDAEVSQAEQHLLARFVELAQVLGRQESTLYNMAQIILGDLEYSASLSALGKLEPSRTAVNPRGWWRAWQDQWTSDGLPPLT